MAETPEKYDLDVELSFPDGLRVTTDTPYRMLVVSDLAGSEQGSLTGPLDSALVDLSADSFDAVMAQALPRASFKGTDPLGGGAMVEIDVAFDSLKSFEPVALAQRLPATRAMMAVRERLSGRLLGKASAKDVTAAVESAVAADASLAWMRDTIQWKPAAPSADPGAVSGLLSQLDLGEDTGETPAPPAPPKSPIGSIVAKAAGSGSSIPAEEASAVRRTLAELDKRVGSWLNAVLHAPQVQAIETAWRSLALLVTRTEFRKGIQLKVLHAPAAQMTERFRERVVDPVFDEGVDAPDLIVVDRQFTNNAPDLEALDEFAQHAASLPAVAFAGVGPGFLGVKNAWQVPTLPPIASLMDQYQFAKWKSLRQEGYARHLGVFFGRGLLREPFGMGQRRSGGEKEGDTGETPVPQQTVPPGEFHYREECLSDKDLVWCSGAMAAATTVSRSVAESGWPSQMAGFVHGRIENLPSTTGGPKNDKKFGPADTQLAQAKIEELAGAGLNVAAPLREADAVIIWNGLSAARPIKMTVEGLHEISLPYQLFAARMSVLLFALKPHLAGKTAEQVVPFVHQHVSNWLGFSGAVDEQQLLVQCRPPDDDPSNLMLAVTVTPPPQILPGGVPVVMGYKLA